MRVNTAQSIALGKRIRDRFGSWDKVRKAAEFKDGVYVLKRAGQAADDVKRKKAPRA